MDLEEKAKGLVSEIANLNIQEDVLSLRIENKALREAITDFEEQINKMKCCGNCKHEINEDNFIVPEDYYCDNCFEFCNWKLRR